MAIKRFEEWNIEIKKQSLHFKFDNQLEQMLQSHTNKIPLVLQGLNDILRFPDAKRKEIYEGLVEVGELPPLPDEIKVLTEGHKQRIDAELQRELDFYQTKWERLCNICTLIVKEQELRATGQVKRNPKGTTYYIDFVNGDDTLNDGSTPTKSNGDGPWATLDKFCESARNAGDKAIVRRGMTQVVSSDLTFLSDGTVVSPIVLEADYDNAWGDRVDLSATGTATLIFGSKTITFSADVSGVLAAGDWIYASGDDNREFAYEVASVVTVTVTLYLPYKGAQAGAGKTMYNIKAAPIWNTAAGNFQVDLNLDNFWKIQGIHFRGTDINGVIKINNCQGGPVLKDCIFEGNGSNDYGVRVYDECWQGWMAKCRFFNYSYGLATDLGAAGIPSWTEIHDCLFDANSVNNSHGFYGKSFDWTKLVDCEFKNHVGFAGGDIRICHRGSIYGRNLLLQSGNEVYHASSDTLCRVLIEDYDQVVGDNRQLNYFSVDDSTPSIQSETTVVRAAGGATSIKCTPNTKLAPAWELSRILLFEYPIYAVKDVAKTYTVYFKSSAVGNWTADPTNSELWIEAEYWGHATNNHRKKTKSTGVVDFNGDDVNWLTLTVTVTPLQTGVLYLRGYYCKTKEAAKSNIFYCDTKIGIA